MKTNKGCASFSDAPTESDANSLGANFKLFASAVLIGIVGLTTGCATSRDTMGWASPTSAARTVKITAVGYGATSSNDGYTAGQKRLMAMRASKLDAYRALAEQVQGVRVNGNSTVASMMAQNDSFRVYVDAYLRGAQLVTVTPMADGNYETTMELTLDDQFFGRFTQQPGSTYSGNIRGSVGAGSVYGGNYYNAN